MKGRLASIKLTCFDPEVYEPSDDSFLLADTLLCLAESWNSGWPRTALEVGSGSGYVIASLALTLAAAGHSAQLWATDLNPAAAAATAATLAAHGAASAVDIVITDLINGLLPRLKGSTDLLLFNPPYVPTPDEEVTRGGIAAAWAGGYRGRMVIDRLMPLVPELLSPTGQMLMVTVPDNDPDQLIRMMETHGFGGKVVATRAADEEALQIVHFWRENETGNDDLQGDSSVDFKCK